MNWRKLKASDHETIQALGLEADFSDSSLESVSGKGFRVRKSDYSNVVLEVPETTYKKHAYRCEYVHPKTAEKKVLFQENSTEDENLSAYGFELTSTGNWKEHRFNLDHTPADD